jgi:hypothetical protein
VDGDEEDGAGTLRPASAELRPDLQGEVADALEPCAIARLVCLDTRLLQRIERWTELARGEPLLRKGERVLHAPIFAATAVTGRAAP